MHCPWRLLPVGEDPISDEFVRESHPRRADNGPSQRTDRDGGRGIVEERTSR